MPLTVNKLSPVLGAEVIGADLSAGGDATFEEVRRALLENGVVVLRDQRDLTPEAHIAFSRRFGELDIHVRDDFLLSGHPEILILSNRTKPDGAPVGFVDAGRYWHSDVSYSERPALGSLLHAVEIPPDGGDTLFTSMYAAYDSLPEETKARIADLKAVHSYAASYSGQTAAGGNRGALSEAQKAQLKEVMHPVVRTHPETGRKALFVNPGFTIRIEGLEEVESRALLTELFKHSTRPEFIYRHKWQSHDLLFWDNRCTMHHATPYDPVHIRHMHRTTIKGDRPV